MDINRGIKWDSCLILSQPDKKDVVAQLMALWLKYIGKEEGTIYTHISLWHDFTYFDGTFKEFYLKDGVSLQLLDKITKKGDLLYFFRAPNIMKGCFYDRLEEFENKRVHVSDLIRVGLGLDTVQPLCTEYIGRLLNVRDLDPKKCTPATLLKQVFFQFKYSEGYLFEKTYDLASHLEKGMELT